MKVETQLDEVFNQDTAKKYEAVNMKPSQKLPQVWKFNVPGNESLMGRLVSFASEGDAVKQVKQGDKFVQFFLMSLSDKGNCGELRGGLGSDPIGAITTIFDTVVDTAKKYKFDAVLFRLPIKKMKGQGPAVQRIMARLALARTGGKYVVLKELWDYSTKYAYVLIHRKNVPLEDIKGIPPVSTELFTVKQTKAGPVYTEKKSGEEVTNDVAVAATIAKVENSRSSDRAVAKGTRISRREFISTQYSKITNTKEWKPELVEKRDKLNSTPPVFETNGVEENKIAADIVNKTVAPVSKYAKQGIAEIKKSASNSESVQNTKDYLRGTGIFPGHILDGEIIDLSAKIETEYFNAVSKYDGSNIVDIVKKLSSLHTMVEKSGIKYAGKLDHRQITDFSKRMIMKFNTEILTPLMQTSYAKMANKCASAYKSKPLQKNAIESYCGKSFGDMNDYLIGNMAASAKITDDLIPNMDKAFENGIKLPKKTVLYRGMQIDREVFKSSIDNKTFYFTNYVSTSLNPQFIATTSDVAGDSEITGNDINSENVLKNYGKPDSRLGIMSIRLGIIINGADVIKVIIPGDLNKFSDECEVILPRGTAVKFDKVYAKSDDMKESYTSSILVQSSVIPLSQMDENYTELYDGDALINEGVVKRFSFSRFLAESEAKEVGGITHDPSMDGMLAAMSFDNMSPKFME